MNIATIAIQGIFHDYIRIASRSSISSAVAAAFCPVSFLSPLAVEPL